jgi:hypothetical protein
MVDAFTQQRELPKYSRLVPLAEIAANDFNLNIPRYIDTSEEEDLQDIDAHLHGGIPERDVDALRAYWAGDARPARHAVCAVASRLSATEAAAGRDQARHFCPPRVHRLQPDRERPV